MFGFDGNHFSICRRFTACLIAFLRFCRFNGRACGLFQLSFQFGDTHTRRFKLGVQFFDFSLKKRLQLNVFGVYIHSCANRLLGFFIFVFYFCHFLSFRRAEPAYLKGYSNQGDTITLHLPLFGLYAPLSRRSPSTNFLAAFSKDGGTSSTFGRIPSSRPPSPFRLTIAL